MITSILVANRGEIARRVFRTCRSMGIATVAVYSDPDAHALHAVEADAAVRLPGETAAETYLRGDRIIEAALAAGADAVHPGYGFLSENAAFAQAVIDAGLVWIGPSPSAIDAMGSKTNAKKLMASVGVPVMEIATVTEADLPVLVKASAGGGGRGMRVVRTMAELPAQLEAARAEAESAFGDSTVFCEPYVADGRHIEVQVLADRHGTMWTVGERECSIQRRYQKIVEEAPSPMVDEALRESLYAAARAAASAVGYEGAGTVEFLVAPDGTFWFLEMNTRLQVEHPVTEALTGLDLVREQIAIARGDRLAPQPPGSAGHAIEARLYAEDAAGRPQTGVLHRFHLAAEHVRVDAGYAEGDAIGVHYDPLLAKVIAWAPTRSDAAAALAGALASARIHGVGTNRDMLVRILRHPAFLDGALAAFLDTHGADTSAPLASEETQRYSAVAAALADASADRRDSTVLKGLPTGWRNLRSAAQRRAYEAPSGRIDVEYAFGRSGVSIVGSDVIVGAVGPETVDLTVNGVRRIFAVSRYGEDLVVVDSALGSVTLTPVPRFPSARTELATGSLTAPMPGTVVRVAVAIGEHVEAGRPLLWLEAMKMQHEVAAPATGTVTELPVALGSQVELGAVLAVVTPDPKEE
jgi:propionyl-CoA carboxylase alpha chain